MKLVVDQLALLLRALLVGELATTDSVADGRHGGALQVHCTRLDQEQSCLTHDGVENAGVGLDLEFTVFHDL